MSVHYDDDDPREHPILVAICVVLVAAAWTVYWYYRWIYVW